MSSRATGTASTSAAAAAAGGGTTSTTTATSPKAAHYNSQLTSALLKGDWTDGHAGKAPNGTDLSWDELIRKWGKHTGENTSLIHHLRHISALYSAPPSHPSSPQTSITVSPAVSQAGPSSSPAHTVPEPAGEAGAKTHPSDRDAHSKANGSGSGGLHIPHPHLRRHKSKSSLVNGTDEPQPPLEIVTSNTFAQPPSSASDPAKRSDDDGPEESSWAVGRRWWCGARLDRVDSIKKGVSDLEALIGSGKLSVGERQSAQVTLAQHLSALGKHEEALKILSAIQIGGLGGFSGDVAVLDRIRASCLKGIVLELLPSSNHDEAIDAYTSAATHLPNLTSLPPPHVPCLSTAANPPKSTFITHREVFRWVSTALSRAAILSAQRSNRNDQTLRILRTYHAYSASWPPSFRPIQRQRMILLYLRALYPAYPQAGTPCQTPYLLIKSPAPTADARTVWRSEVTEAFTLGRALLSSTTTFPKAGSVNHPVIAFVELCVSLADKSPTLDRDAISVLWWAMTYTFQSPSVLRHLTRMLAAVGDSDDARRIFELYVKLILKDRETHQPEISLQLKRRPTEGAALSPEEINQEIQSTDVTTGRESEKRETQRAEAEVDSDEDFVGALLVGSRLFLRHLGDAEEAWRYACLAGDVVDQAIKRRHPWLTDRIRAEIAECKGIVRMAMGMRGGDPVTRPKLQAQSLDHLTKATSLDPTSSSAFYHLSYCQAEARSIEAATDSIRQAIELDARDIQAWHLLALLLTAQGDWTAAAKACEAGVSVWEQEEEREVREMEGNSFFDVEKPGESDPTVDTKDFAEASTTHPAPIVSISAPQTGSEPLLFPSGEFKPTKIMVRPTHPPAVGRVVRLEHVIRLRMTANVITEKIQGPEIAMVKQQELFAFFSARSGKNRGQAVPVTKALPESTSTVSFAPVTGVDSKSVEEDFVNLNMDDDPVESGTVENSIVAVQPPTPIMPDQPSSSTDSSPRASRDRAASITSSTGAGAIVSPDVSNSESDTPQTKRPMSLRDVARDPRRSFSGGRSLSGTKKLVAKHLHVPMHQPRSRPSSVRRASTKQDLRMSLGTRDRVASSSSAALSVAPTAVHSHFRQSTGRFNRTPPPPPVQPADHGRTPAESRILSNLWLMSAATFRRWGKLEQCLVAIEEAEVLDPENNLVWVQLGLYHLEALQPNYEAALPAFIKAILLKPDNPPGIVNLAKAYMNTGQVDLAHTMLNQLTQDAGWDVPEAWYYLGKVCEIQGRGERARECWRYALSLEETKPARRLSESVDRWL